MYKIYGKYPGEPKEVVDEFDSKEEAREMLTEYKMAYGNEWKLWIEKARN